MARTKKNEQLPDVMISRLTRYLTCLQTFFEERDGWISSQEIAEALSITGATVRRDLARLDLNGVTNKGYETKKLHNELFKFMGAEAGWTVAVAGAGNLGKALALHGNLARLGIKISGIFDIDGRKIGKKVGKLTVRSTDEMPGIISKSGIDMGIITVPAKSAQAVADIMIVAGIKGIFNLSFTHVVAPKNVKVVEGRLVTGILELGHAINTTMKL